MRRPVMVNNKIKRCRVAFGRSKRDWKLRNTMNTKKLLLTAGFVTIICCFLLAIWWLAPWHFSQEIAEASKEKARKVLIDQIVSFKAHSASAGRIIGAPAPKKPLATQSEKTYKIVSQARFDRYSAVTVEPSMQRVADLDDSVKREASSIEPIRNVQWLLSDDAILDLRTQALSMNRDWTYGWLQVGRPTDLNAVRDELSFHDATVLGSTGSMVRVKFPADLDQLTAIADLPWVLGAGAQPTSTKTSQEFMQNVMQTSASTLLPVFITVMDESVERTLRTELEALGVVMGQFDQAIRTFAAVIKPSQLTMLVHLDFVQAIEPIEIVTASHDTAVQTMGVDSLRTVGDSFGIYSGITGVSTPIAVMDTGLNTNHVAISSHRKSICGENFISGEDSDLWVDNHGHGSHVTGTVAGNGYYLPLLAGMAPGVEHIRFAKVLSSSGFGSTLGITRAMDFLGSPTSCIYDGHESEAVKPLVINMSLSSSSLFWESRDTGARKLDSAVWNYKQLYVVSNANSNTSGYSNYSAAKNSLAVGSVRDSGDIASSSSHGPTADGRLNPSVMGTGVNVYSAQGNGSYDTYRRASGTSMSSPSVAGVAALLMDASPEHRDKPALVRARLMASAIKPNAWLDSSDVFPRDNTNGPGTIQAEYGMGLVSARTSILNNDTPNGWVSSGVTVELDDGEYGYHDIVVPEGTSRLDIVMTWDEPATDTIAQPVLNDLNLWVDHLADCESGPCGEYSSRSTIDSVEWVIIHEPEPGTYRLKVDGHRVYTDSPRAAVAWTVIRGDAMPSLAIEADTNVYETPDGEYHKHVVELSITSTSYVSSATRLHVDCRTSDGSVCGAIGFEEHEGTLNSRFLAGIVQREDGLGVDIVGERFLNLGEIAHGETQNVLVDLSTRIREPIRVFFTVASWNGLADSTSVVFRPNGSSDTPIQMARPTNDDFASPTLLTGSQGSLAIDPIGSTTEGGEAPLEFSDVRPAGSVWFRWLAEKSGRVSFLLTPSIENLSFMRTYPPDIEVFQSDGVLAGSPRIGSSLWSIQLFVRQGEEYRIRVSHDFASMPLTLHWVEGERPPNDDFANAIELLGSEGDIAGNNLGATLEPGELYGRLASSVWYRWTAPEDGTWEFHLDDIQSGNILVFVGESVSELRLVSTVAAPRSAIRFVAEEGQTYRVMVAAQDAYSGGSNYESLSWVKVDDVQGSDDMFASASTLDSEESGSIGISVSANSSVEPNEPADSGIQTRWRKWEAPSDGLYTWYWTEETTKVQAFTGDSIENLQPAQVLEGVAHKREFVIDATEGDEYWLSIGRPNKETQAFVPGASTFTELHWGETPVNNTLARAQTLTSHIGQMTIASQYATTEPDGKSHLGLSSLWYSREVSEAGWVRFWIDGSADTVRLTAYLRSQGSEDLEFVMSSRVPGFFDDYPIEVFIYAEEGSTIILRVGDASAHSESSHSLRWDNSDAPNWLRFLGRVAHNRRDSAGNVVTLRNPRELVVDSEGSRLLVATDAGLSVFRRDSTTGDLSFSRHYSEVHPHSHLVWDSHRSRLYANHMNTWWTFAPVQDSEVDLELVSVDYGLGATTRRNFNGSRSLSMGVEGNYLYRTLNGEQSVFSFDGDGKITHYGDFRLAPPAVYQSIEQAYWFEIDDDYITLERRITGGPFYERLQEPAYIGSGGWSAATTFDGEYVIVPDEIGVEIVAYRLNTDSGALDEQASELYFGLGLAGCWTAVPRRNSHAMDVICDRGGFVIEYLPDDEEFRLADNFVNSGFFFRTPDRWGRLVPNYSLTESVSVAPSTDGKHLYASTIAHGILIFERIGNEPLETQDMDDQTIKRLDLIHAMPNKIEFGDDVAENGCIETLTWSIAGVDYGVFWSKWQERETGSDWVDIEGTEVNLQLCSYDPAEDKEYRMVASLAVDGEIGEYASNFFSELNYETLASLVVASGEVTLNDTTFTECTTISAMEINEVTYSVASSKWQVRESADSPWSDVAGTHTAGGFCPYDPSDNLDYRLVGRIVINDERSFRTSNILNESADN